MQISSEGQRLQIVRTSLSDAGNYSCVALNRAGETSLDFYVEILCTHLASEHCRYLENRHIESIKAAYKRRRDEYRRLAAGRDQEQLEQQQHDSSYKTEIPYHNKDALSLPPSSAAKLQTFVVPKSYPVYSQYYAATPKTFTVITPYTVGPRAHHARFHVLNEHRKTLAATPIYPYYNYSLIGVTVSPYLDTSTTRIRVRVETDRHSYRYRGQNVKLDDGSVISLGSGPGSVASVQRLHSWRKPQQRLQANSRSFWSQESEKPSVRKTTSKKPCIPEDDSVAYNSPLERRIYKANRVDSEWDKVRAAAEHKLRRPHHFHHHRQYPEVPDTVETGSFVADTQTTALKQQRIDDMVKSCDEYKAKHPWGGKRLRFQRQWQPWDPDYSDEPWTSWYTYKKPKLPRQRRRLRRRAKTAEIVWA